MVQEVDALCARCGDAGAHAALMVFLARPDGALKAFRPTARLPRGVDSIESLATRVSTSHGLTSAERWLQKTFPPQRGRMAFVTVTPENYGPKRNGLVCRRCGARPRVPLTKLLAAAAEAASHGDAAFYVDPGGQVSPQTARPSLVLRQPRPLSARSLQAARGPRSRVHRAYASVRTGSAVTPSGA